MKKLALLLCVVLTFTGCSSFMGKSNITNLLEAPKFSQTESEIADAIDDYIGENISLRYSHSQGYSSPVQLIDIDGDGAEEAVVFYYAPNKGANIRMALLKNTADGWEIVMDKEGLGTEVFYFSTVELEGLSTKQILAGYLTANIDENFFAAYFTDPEYNIPDYAESCQNIIVGDVTYDGYDDIILTNRVSDGRIRLRSFDFTDNGFRLVGTRLLKFANIDITQLKLAESLAGEVVLYADYRSEYNQMHTEGMVFRDGGKMFDAFASTVVSKQWEYARNLNCTDIDGDGYMETPSVINDVAGGELAVLKTVEWTDYTLEQPVRKYIGIYDTQHGLFAAVPDSWQGNVEKEYTDDGWMIYRKSDAENAEDDKTERLLFTVKQVEYRNNIETGAYSYIIYKDTKTWHFDFTKNVELSEIQHILKSVKDLS